LQLDGVLPIIECRACMGWVYPERMLDFTCGGGRASLAHVARWFLKHSDGFAIKYPVRGDAELQGVRDAAGLPFR